MEGNPVNTPKDKTFTIHIKVLANNEFEYSPRGIHIGEAQTVNFVADKNCDVVFLQPHYFKSDKVPLTKDADGPAHLQGRKPTDPHDRESKWQVWMLVNGKPVHLTTHAHAVVGTAVSSRESSFGTAVMDMEGRGDPDPIIQP
jgi:hypothetical protein